MRHESTGRGGKGNIAIFPVSRFGQRNGTRVHVPPALHQPPLCSARQALSLDAKLGSFHTAGQPNRAGCEVGEFSDAITEAAQASEAAKSKSAADTAAKAAKLRAQAIVSLEWLQQQIEALLVTAGNDVASHHVEVKVHSKARADEGAGTAEIRYVVGPTTGIHSGKVHTVKIDAGQRVQLQSEGANATKGLGEMGPNALTALRDELKKQIVSASRLTDFPSSIVRNVVP